MNPWKERCSSVEILLGRLVVMVVSALAIIATNASACMCSGIHGRTAWETAEKEAQGSKAIFEGTLERSAVEWALSAKPGDSVSADETVSEELLNNWPRMIMTWRVKRAYKGDLGTEVQIRTGMGGGDCGSRYETGLDYLVYTFERSPGELWVYMCSPGGWLGSNYLATELRYLRKERPLKGDLNTLDYWTPSAKARRDREREEFIRRYTTATGQICGIVSPEILADGERASIAFLSTAGYSPPPWRSVSEVNREGKFCSDRLGPGGYYLYLTQGLRGGGALDLAMYYPGVVDRAKAAIVKVEAGQVRSNLTFRIPKQGMLKPKTYTVHGFISTDDKVGLGANGVSVMLVSLDGELWYREPVDFRGLVPLPKVKYFNFENVLPGRYTARALVPGRGWSTRVVDVSVATRANLIFLELKHSKANPADGRPTR